jgi:hypothetical protein
MKIVGACRPVIGIRKIPVNPHILEIYGITVFVFIRRLDIIGDFQSSDERVEIEGIGVATRGLPDMPALMSGDGPASRERWN